MAAGYSIARLCSAVVGSVPFLCCVRAAVPFPAFRSYTHFVDLVLSMHMPLPSGSGMGPSPAGPPRPASLLIRCGPLAAFRGSGVTDYREKTMCLYNEQTLGMIAPGPVLSPPALLRSVNVCNSPLKIQH